MGRRPNWPARVDQKELKELQMAGDKARQSGKRVLSTKEVARALDCTPGTVLKAVKLGRIPPEAVYRTGTNTSRFKFDPVILKLALTNQPIAPPVPNGGPLNPNPTAKPKK
jgi:hypothetical protein